jgi:hypothetical protein
MGPAKVDEIFLPNRQWFRPQVSEPLLFPELIVGVETQPPEAAVVVETKLKKPGRLLVLPMGPQIQEDEVVFANRVRTREEEEVPRHLQMRPEGRLSGEADEDVLASSVDT